jgi:predicted ATP-grasp superfamily ATP-dependent carboligase
LLEVNPRFNLWHNPGARAGVNLPALVYADLTGTPRPEVRPARAGVRWCNVVRDWRAARSQGVGLPRWVAWALSCETSYPATWDDPLPLLAPGIMRLARRLR